jgi:retron-type reverse transcriptase
MADDDKAKLYHEIVQQTDKQSLLERMRLHGFWPDREGVPQDPPDEASERARIEAEMAQLRKTQSLVQHPAKALAAERKRRWQESKKRRAEAKAKRAAEHQKRLQEWEAEREGKLVYAGEGVSGGLQNTQSDVEALTCRELPVMHTAADLAAKLNINLPALRWLTYHRRGATVVHYHRFQIAKKTGGVRAISAPKPALAMVQRWVLENILMRLSVSPQAHGFLRGHSIVTNALPHVNRAVVVNLDLKNFFPSISFRRVKGLFRGLGYSEHLATVLALICTEPPRVAAAVDGKIYFVALGERVLPQGACTSPAVTNVLCRRLDCRLNGLAKKRGFVYTRYADDLTFSGDNPRVVGRLLRSVRSFLAEEGFNEHPTKTRVMRRANRQEVTGVTVNTRPTVAREEVRTLRAILHNAARHGLESQNRDRHPNFAAYLRGRVEFICMVDSARATQWRNDLDRALGGQKRKE